jgi:SSS family solute:Na+ symporter
MVYGIIIAVYFAIMLLIGIFMRKRAQNPDGFFVAGRSGSLFLIAGSLIATIIGGSATVGMAGLGFKLGLTGAWWVLVGSIGLIILGLFLAKKIRSTGLYTLPELVETQYNSAVALTTSVLVVFSWIAIIAGQILAAGTILSVMGFGNPTLWMVLFTFVFVTYTIIGGQHADIATDFVQAAIICIGVFCSLAVISPHVGGLSGLKSALTPDAFSFPLSAKFGATDLLSYLLLIGLAYVVGPDMYSRILSARDAQTARRSTLWSGGLLIPIAFAITLVGMAAAVLYPQIAAEQAFPTIVKELLPPVAGGLVLAALIAATMSSADSCLLSASAILSVDVIKRFRPSLSDRQVVFVARCAIIVLGVLSLFLALAMKGVINALMLAYTLYTAGVIIPVLAGFYRNKLKVTPAGAIAAIIGGGTVALISKLPGIIGNAIPPVTQLCSAIKHLDLWALAVSAVLLLLVSFIDNWLNRRMKPATHRR